MKKIKPRTSWLRKKAGRGFRGYPIATVAFYGPTAELATKIVVSIVPDQRSQPDLLDVGSRKEQTSATTPSPARRFRTCSVSITHAP